MIKKYNAYMINESLLDDVEVDEVKDEEQYEGHLTEVFLSFRPRYGSILQVNRKTEIGVE